MAARLNRSQLEVLIKRRSHLSEQQLYEMMKSRHVFQVQIGLRRGLEQVQKSIRRDEKLVLAGLHCEKALFLKRVESRKKTLRCLVSVDILLEDTDTSESGKKRIEENEDALDAIDGFSTKASKSYPKLKGTVKEPTVFRHGEKEPAMSTTPNELWMRAVSERTKTISSTLKSTKEPDKKHIDKREPLSFSTLSALSTLDESTANVSKSSPKAHRLKDVEHRKKKTLQHVQMAPSDWHALQETPKRRQNNTNDDGLTSLSMRIRSSSFQQAKGSSYPFRVRESHQKSAPSVSRTDRLVRLDNEKRTRNIPARRMEETPRKEKTIAMMFVEREDGDNWPTVSPFDVETWLEQNRRRRGHSIVVSTAFLYDANSQHPSSTDNKAPLESTSQQRKCRRDSKRPSHKQPPLRLRQITEDQANNARKRGNDWFTSFLTKKNKTSCHRTDQLEDLKLKPDVLRAHTNLRGGNVLLPPIRRCKDKNVEVNGSLTKEN